MPRPRPRSMGSCAKRSPIRSARSSWPRPRAFPEGTVRQPDGAWRMKLAIIGTGNVGCAIALAAVTRGSAREIVLVNRTRKTAEAVATDLRYGTPLSPKVDIRDGDYADLAGAGVVLITSGVNEKTGGATDRTDPQGRLRLLDKNAALYSETV